MIIGLLWFEDVLYTRLFLAALYHGQLQDTGRYVDR